MKQKTAMQELLAQLKDERTNLPLNIEWDRCYQAIEMVIQNTYLEKEKEQIMDAAIKCHFEGVRQSAKTSEEYISYGEQYYNETYKQD